MTDGFYTLRRGHQGSDVARLQRFLSGQNIELQFGIDGDYGGDTMRAVKRFQQLHGQEEDGAFGDDCRGVAIQLDYTNVQFPPPIPETSADVTKAKKLPPKPDSPPQPTADHTAELFGAFEFEHVPTLDNPERIRILGGWEAENIINIEVPELVGMVDLQTPNPRFMETGRVRCHRLAAPKIQRLFQRWAEAGLMDRVLYYVGCFNARLKRKATQPTRRNLSNHSWGTAFDINSRENPLGKPAAIHGQRGCVRELVGIANEEGFYWGGHFNTGDGMHFELARLD